MKTKLIPALCAASVAITVAVAETELLPLTLPVYTSEPETAELPLLYTLAKKPEFDLQQQDPAAEAPAEAAEARSLLSEMAAQSPEAPAAPEQTQEVAIDAVAETVAEAEPAAAEALADTVAVAEAAVEEFETPAVEEFETPAPEPAPAPVAPVVAEVAAPAPVAPAVAAPAPVIDDTIVTDEIEIADDAAEAAKQPRITSAAADPAQQGNSSLVNIDCDGATIEDIIRQFRRTTGANIISGNSTNLSRRVSVSLRNVPWYEGMTAILSAQGFRIEERNNIYRVIEDVQKEPKSTRTYQLNHASAKELEGLFNATYGHKDTQGKITAPIASSFEGANVVVVTATDKVLAECDAIIKAVDKAIPQIYIEARFLELSSAALHKLGIQWDALESWGVSVHDIKAGWEHNSGRPATYHYNTRSGDSNISGSLADKSGYTYSASKESSSSSTSGSFDRSFGADINRGVSAATLAPEGIADAIGAGISASSMGWRDAAGFAGQLSADDFRLAMSAFEELGEGKIFSNPKIIVANGKVANVDMTTKFPNVRVTSTRNTSNGSDSLDISTQIEVIPGDTLTAESVDGSAKVNTSFFQWGITLSVRPRISPDGTITVDIVPTISDCQEFFTVASGDSGAYSKYPIIDVKRLTTCFTMNDGSTAVIGGLSKTVEEDVDSGIPYLRKIPWIGPKLFGWKSRQKVQKEIVVCVTVGIANPAALPSDVGLPTNAILGREYFNGNRYEPGLRPNAAANSIRIDTRSLDDEDRLEDLKKSAEGVNKGTVTITPVK